MTSGTSAPPEAPATPSDRLARTPLWARIAVPAFVIAAGAAIVTSVVAAGAQPPATVEALCRAAVEAGLENRGHSDIDVTPSMQVTEADGAKRVSGTVKSVDESGISDHAQLRCVVRGEGDAMRVVSVRFSPR
jgi:hypothetical protein